MSLLRVSVLFIFVIVNSRFENQKYLLNVWKVGIIHVSNIILSLNIRLITQESSSVEKYD